VKLTVEQENLGNLASLCELKAAEETIYTERRERYLEQARDFRNAQNNSLILKRCQINGCRAMVAGDGICTRHSEEFEGHAYPLAEILIERSDAIGKLVFVSICVTLGAALGAAVALIFNLL
jgi:hypothetical protein